MKVVVLGAGVSGLTLARTLFDNGHDVVVYEKESTVGGLARTRVTDGYTYDPHGGHIFNSSKSEIVNWIFSMLPKSNWQFTERNAKIFFDGKYISYPFELSLCELNDEDKLNCAYDYMMAQSGDEPSNYQDWLIWNFGKSIADYYMLPYNSKIWSYPLKDMGTTWMRGKMPLPTKKELLNSLLMKNPKERKMPHSTFYYPIDGGIQTMVDAIAEPLKLRVSTTVDSIQRVGDKWVINKEDSYDYVVSTIPLPVLGDAMVLPDEVMDAIRDLKYNSLTTVLFNCPPTDITWLYIPNAKFKAHRVGYQSALTPHATPYGDGCGALEIIGHAPIEVTPNFIDSASIIPSELQAKKVLDSQFTEYAYVIHDKNYVKNTTVIKDYFESVDQFNLLGRWGTWNYNNMDMCMFEARELAKKCFGADLK